MHMNKYLYVVQGKRIEVPVPTTAELSEYVRLLQEGRPDEALELLERVASIR
jgi:hypothetical protein